MLKCKCRVCSTTQYTGGQILVVFLRLTVRPTLQVSSCISIGSVELTTTERKLLFYLLEHADQICTFEAILGNVWGWAYRGSTQYVHVYISRLRQKLDSLAP